MDVSPSEESAMLSRRWQSLRGQTGQASTWTEAERTIVHHRRLLRWVDHNLTLLGPIVNTGLENAIADNNLILHAVDTDGAER